MWTGKRNALEGTQVGLRRLPPSMWMLVGAVWLVVAGCGPSFQAIYNGEARFERCYAMEERVEVSLQAKRECWEVVGWIATRMRRRGTGWEYASSRYKALSQLPVMPTDEALMEGAPGGGERTHTALPAPTNAFAPPVKTVSAECTKCVEDVRVCKNLCASGSVRVAGKRVSVRSDVQTNALKHRPIDSDQSLPASPGKGLMEDASAGEGLAEAG